MDVGFRRAGIEAVFANELDDDAASTYTANPQYLNPQCMHKGDIADYLDCLEDFAGCDVVFGGPPCQGFSVAGKMNPHDERSRLVWTFMKVVETVRPKLFVMENVKALGVLSKWEPVRKGLRESALEQGYGCAMAVLNASDFGVPQARERFVFIGVKDADSDEVEHIFKESLVPLEKKPATVREIFALLPAYGETGNTLGSNAEVRVAKHPRVRASAYRGSLLFNGRGRPVDLDNISKTLPAQMGGNHTPIVDQRLLDDPASADWIRNYHAAVAQGSLDPSTDRIEVPSSLRRMTVAEAAALQTFPLDFKFSGRYGSQYRQIGNAVPCDFAFAIAQAARATAEALCFS